MSLLGDVLRGKTGPQRRAAGALWQRVLRRAPSSGAPLVVFALPLVSKRRAADWDMVSVNLRRTLASLAAQTSPHWRAYVSGQDRPDGIEFGERVRFVEYRGSDKFYDKGDKRLLLIDTAMADLGAVDGYYAQFDADDLLHPEVVSHITSDDNGHGYLIDKGYMADLDAGHVARLAPSEGQGPEAARAFWQLCGSCVFARFDFRTQPRHWRRLLRRLKSHKRMGDVMAQHGLPLAPIPFPAGVYVVNHGENMSRRRQREEWRLNYLTRNALSAEEARAALEPFGVG